jgi:NMD protein affecting ribosome stability and mRNA decay
LALLGKKKGEKMKQVCYECGKLYGIKEPYEDDSETHGLCQECFDNEMKKLNALPSHWDGRHPNDPITS